MEITLTLSTPVLVAILLVACICSGLVLEHW